MRVEDVYEVRRCLALECTLRFIVAALNVAFSRVIRIRDEDGVVFYGWWGYMYEVVKVRGHVRF